jgi:tetratricopeptide (TPR) repeat protein
MAESEITILPEAKAIDGIVETVQLSEPASAPFALVLGSGFSHGLVPTARELVETSLPLWMKSKCRDEVFDQLTKGSPEEHNGAAREFWKRFVERNVDAKVALDPSTGLPEDYSAAYRAAFNPKCSGAVGKPAQSRSFQRRLMRLDQPRLNAAHFLLASLLGVQPRKNRKSDLFKAEAAFSRLILTTNFDPFLQTALQAVNRLYFMSDTPYLGVSDEIYDDQTDAIHIVYLHGSIHRRSQIASEEEIRRIKEKNAQTLAPVLKRRGIIVLGYSGWDDAIVEALAACDEFDNLLYWCGRESDPMAKGAFGPRVREILEKETASYVKIQSAGRFMAQLCSRLVDGLPRLLGNPVGQLREMLETIDLSELNSLTPTPSSGSLTSDAMGSGSAQDVFVGAQKAALERLAQAEKLFIVSTSTPSRSNGTPEQRAARTAKARQFLSSARAASTLGLHGEAIKLYTQALELGSLEVNEHAELLLDRGIAFHSTGKITEAQNDWTQLIELPGATVEQRTWALYDRGVTWWQQGEPDKAIADYTQVIEHSPAAPAEQTARAHGNRGWVYYQRKQYPAFLKETEAALAKQPALDNATFNLGLALLANNRDDEALAAYKRAKETFPNAIETHGITDILEAQKTWLTPERAEPIVRLLQPNKSSAIIKQ